MSVHIASKDITRVVLQYLRETGAHKAAIALSEETGVFLNSTEYPSQLQLDIRNGKWERVMHELQFLDLPKDVVQDIFEEIVLDLLGKGSDRAELLPFIDQAAPFATDGLRRHKLIRFLDNPGSAPSADSRKEKRRELSEKVGHFLASETQMPSHRLVTLLEDFARLKNPGLVDMRLDLLTGEVQPYERTVPLTKLGQSVDFPPDTEIKSIAFSSDGKYLVVGAADGLIEFYSTRNFKVDETSLSHQKSGNFFFHNFAVTAMASSGDLFFSGDAEGHVKVWSVARGLQLRESRISTYQTLSLTVLPDQASLAVLTSRKLSVVQISDLRVSEAYSVSGNSGFTCAAISEASAFVGDDAGWINVFQRDTAGSTKKFRPPVPSFANPDETRRVQQLVLRPNGNLVVLTQGPFITELTAEGKFVNFFCAEDRETKFVQIIAGKRFLYLVAELRGVARLTALDVETWKPVHEQLLSNERFSGIVTLHAQELMLALGMGRNRIQIVS